MNLVKLPFLLFLVWLGHVYGASFSKVYVHAGSEQSPYQYVNYGAPLTYQGNQLAQLSAAPVGSVVPYSNVVAPPCVSPCIPAQPVASIVNPGLVAYKAPSAPVVVATNDPTSYEYSYAVYDENTGDQKWQKELSDGLVVRGQYSLVQPDGFVREVQYTADDATGFNAVVKKFLPESGVKAIVVKQEPCEPKNEALKEKKEEHAHEAVHAEAPAHEKIHQAHAEEPVHAEEPAHGEVHAEEPTHGHHAPEAAAHVEEQAHSKEPAHEEEPAHAAELNHAKEPPEVHAQHAEEHAPEHTPAVVTEVHKVTSAEVKEEAKPVDHSKETPEEHATHAVVEPLPIVQYVQQPPQNVLLTNQPTGDFISYSQLLKCIETMKNLQQRSPLSYIVLPSKPCLVN